MNTVEKFKELVAKDIDEALAIPRPSAGNDYLSDLLLDKVLSRVRGKVRAAFKKSLAKEWTEMLEKVKNESVSNSPANL